MDCCWRFRLPSGSGGMSMWASTCRYLGPVAAGPDTCSELGDSCVTTSRGWHYGTRRARKKTIQALKNAENNSYLYKGLSETTGIFQMIFQTSAALFVAARRSEAQGTWVVQVRGKSPTRSELQVKVGFNDVCLAVVLPLPNEADATANQPPSPLPLLLPLLLPLQPPANHPILCLNTPMSSGPPEQDSIEN